MYIKDRCITDGVVLVVGSGEVDMDLVKIAKDRLEKLNANILGAILNKYDSKGSNYHYYYNEDKGVNKK